MEKRWGPRESGVRSGRDSHRHGIVRRDEVNGKGVKVSQLTKAQVKDEAKISSQRGDFLVAGLDTEARRAEPKGGNGRVKHSRSNAAVLSVLGGPGCRVGSQFSAECLC